MGCSDEQSGKVSGLSAMVTAGWHDRDPEVVHMLQRGVSLRESLAESEVQRLWGSLVGPLWLRVIHLCPRIWHQNRQWFNHWHLKREIELGHASLGDPDGGVHYS